MGPTTIQLVAIVVFDANVFVVVSTIPPDKVPPAYILPATPTPPSTTNEPVVVLVLGVGDPADPEKVTEPELVHL